MMQLQNLFLNQSYTRMNTQDTITIFGTRGEERKAIVEGYVLLNYKGRRSQIKYL